MEVIRERYELSCGRIREIAAVQEVAEEYKDYFKKVAEFILLVAEACDNRGKITGLEELRKENRALYADILDAHYAESYANPVYACGKYGLDMGRLLAFLYTEIRAMIPYAFEQEFEDLVIRMELFVEIYNAFAYTQSEAELLTLPEKAAVPNTNDIRDTLYWFVSDYSETASANRVRSLVDADCDFAVRIVEDSDLNDLSYLYQYGEYVSPDVEKMAEYLNSLPDERIQLMADTYTEGYRIGFEKAHIDLGKKETVDLHYMLGFERVVRAAIANFAKMGLKPTVYRCENNIFGKSVVRKKGYFGADANRQFLYDHKDDIALFLDKKLVNRKLEVLKLAYEAVKEKAAVYAGPAVIEVFGELPFAPESRDEACSLDAGQQKLSAELKGASQDIVSSYINEEERSFTIIAFPVPSIGERFVEIFDETIRLNTLDYKTYERIQAAIIDTLNTAAYVEIKGMNGNRTDLRVALYPVSNPEKEAVFENCVADVNIPVGEVFTSPVLEGTCGKLHVSRVFLNELEYHNLEIDFKDGMIVDYTCTNFDSEEKNRAYIKENVLYHYDSLPMGEFAIGTNTTAYMTAKKYDIANLFPILIAEKTGPHFAVGDTCFSRSEEVRVFNEDGKEVVAKDNSVSILRKTEPSKAYFACHTDITIPYDELGSIIAYDKAGHAYSIIEKGRFVLAGTEELNEPFDQCG
ncbi:MAG: aminopeptidase [Lachnospiraceae bacterium]|nr:aminopeptidase [Lachnospiraceae bacterium]